ncbi:helix-turn-helix domain-containing protein [Streptomyces sp. NPDC056069]|uniref:helix-turn-helix domain-containing protein n=1 Tax=Streptomyces sp. NPDC056069 TaxID=3345702 RepID=UPI0035E2A666
MDVHGTEVRQRALTLLRGGARNCDVARRLNVPYGTISYWKHMDLAQRGECPGSRRAHSQCPRCERTEFDENAYAYLLGLYLGDGHIISRDKQHHLSIYCNATQTGLIDAAEDAMRRVMPLPRTSRRHRTGCVEVKSYTRHWKCLFPQHGPGKKHERPIVLEPWQQRIVDAHPWEFVRGLIHSDGCRVVNWTTRVVRGEKKRYEYVRYFFTNVSDDIRRLCTDTLDGLGVEWRHCTRAGRPYNISVARRASVALMELHVGPKH